QEEFRKVPLTKALEEIGESTGLNVVIDARAEKKADVEVTARLNNVPVEIAVRLLADMAGLDVGRIHNVLYVTTPENAARLDKAKGRWEKLVAPNRGSPGGM